MTTTPTTPKKPHAGGDIAAYCTKCRMDLEHRIVAMVGNTVKRVICLTCNGEHNYRKPQSAKGEPKKTRAPRAAGSRASAPKTEKSLKLAWERSIAGQPTTAFRAYSIKTGFTTGELIRHTKFGDGVISRIVDPSKVEVLFEDGVRIMAQNSP